MSDPVTANSPVYWEANGFNLNTMAWSVKSYGTQRWAGPPRRGENIQVPLRDGRTYTDKFRDSRQYEMVMWVLPYDPLTGERDTTMPFEKRIHRNYRQIVDAVDVDGQFPLKKRWWGEDGLVHSAVAQAEYIASSGPDTDDKLGYNYSITMELADPYFYAEAETSTGSGLISPLGDAPTNHVRLDLTVSGAARVDFSDGNWFEYDGPGGNLIVDSFTGLTTLDGDHVNGLMSRHPDFARYLRLDPQFPVTVAFTSGISAGSVIYTPAYR